MTMDEATALELLEELKEIPAKVQALEEGAESEVSLASLAQRVETVAEQVTHDHGACPECTQRLKVHGERVGREVFRQIGASASKHGLADEADQVAEAYRSDVAGLETPKPEPVEPAEKTQQAEKTQLTPDGVLNIGDLAVVRA